MELARTYRKQGGLLERSADLRRQVETDRPRQAKQCPGPGHPTARRSIWPPKTLRRLLPKYEAGASMAQLKGEHHMARRTVTMVPQESGVTIRPRGGQYRCGWGFRDHDPAIG